MTLRDDQKDVLVAMGLALLQLQSVEKLIRICLTYVLQRNSPLTMESLLEQEEAERNKTIGHFLVQLRKRAGLDSEFDALLKLFLKNRNDFVHDLSRVVDGGLQTPESTAATKAFVHTLLRQTDAVMRVFAGLVRAWQLQEDFPAPPSNEWFAEVDARYVPLVNDVFFKKGT